MRRGGFQKNLSVPPSCESPLKIPRHLTHLLASPKSQWRTQLYVRSFLIHTAVGNGAVNKFGTFSLWHSELFIPRLYSQAFPIGKGAMRCLEMRVDACSLIETSANTPRFPHPYGAISSLGIRILLANSCTRRRGIFKGFSQNKGTAGLSKNLHASPFYKKKLSNMTLISVRSISLDSTFKLARQSFLYIIKGLALL